MKKHLPGLLVSTSFLLFGLGSAQAADGSVDIRTGGKPREVLVTIKNTADACGMEVRFGDGRAERRRIDTGETWTLNHSFGVDGNFAIQAEGVSVMRGLRSASACQFSQQAMLAVAGANATLQAVATANPADVPAPVAAAARMSPAAANPVATAAPPRGATQGPQQDMLVMVRIGARSLRFVSTLDGGKRLTNGQELGQRGTTACVIKYPKAYGDLPDDEVDALASVQLRRHLAQLADAKDVTVRPMECIVSDGSQSRFQRSADIVVIQRQAIQALRSAAPEFAQFYEPLHEISYSSLFALAEQMRDAAVRRQQALASRASELDALAQSNSTEKVGSLAFGLPRNSGALAYCTLTYTGEQGAAILAYAHRGLATQSDEFRAQAERARASLDSNRPYAKAYASLEALFEARQTKPGECSVYVDFPANLKKLATALQRDGKTAVAINQLVEASVLRDEWAKRAGYQDYAQYQNTRDMKVNAQQFKALGQYQIADKASMDAAMREMQASSYSNEVDVSNLLAYLKDKAEAQGKAGASAVSVRDARQKAAQEASAAQEVAERQRREEYAKQYPYIAVLTCGMPQHINILACFSGGSRGVDTELKLRNGDNMTMYKVYNLREAGQERRDGFYIDLRSKFNLQAQNSDETLILSLKIMDRVSGRVIHNDQAARFGVVSARN